MAGQAVAKLKTETERERCRRACERHLQDLRRAHDRPPPDVAVKCHRRSPEAAQPDARLLVLHVPRRTLRGVDVMSLKPRRPASADPRTSGSTPRPSG